MAHEIKRLLKRNQDKASGTLRKLQFYRLAVELEQMKEPSVKDWFWMPLSKEPLSVRFVDNAEFRQACREDREKRFPQDVCVALFVSDGETRNPLFQFVHQYADIKDLDIDSEETVLCNPLSEFSVNLSVAGEMDLNETQIEALERFLHGKTPTILGLKEALSTIIGAEVELFEQIGVSLSSKNPALSQLVSELKRLGQETNLTGLMVDFLENRSFENQIEVIDSDRLVALAPMDDAQRKAVAAALGSRVSVVTGPPGCGKTQVILNILANAVLHGKSVLVSSKNNKAVDNVRDRLVRELGLEYAIVRFGSRMIRDAQTIPGLNTMVTVSQTLASRRALCEEDRAEAKRIHEAACEDLSKAKKLIAERTDLNATLTDLRDAKNIAAVRAAEAEDRAEHVAQNFLKRHSSYRVFDGYGEAELDDVVMPFRRARNAFARRFSGPGKLWIDWFTKRKHAAMAIDAVMSLPVGIRKLVEGSVRLHAADDFRNGRDVLEYYRDADRELAAGLAYLNESVKLSAKLQSEIEAARNAALVAAKRLSDCEARLAWIAAKRPDDLLENSFKTIQANACRLVSAEFAFRLSGSSVASKIVAFRNYVLNGVPWQYQELQAFERDVRSFIGISPLMAITSLSAKGSLPLAPDLFDMLIIDEASQCDVASALPLMYRAKQVVVIGDPQQLKHISANKLADEKMIKDHLGLINVPYLRYAESSLWDCSRDWQTKASGQKTPVMLNGHYRCHKNIIEYSNRMFYRHMGGLIVRTPEFKNPLHKQGCFWVDVVGQQVSSQVNVNYAEVDKALEIAVRLAGENPEISIGLVTSFKSQAEKMHAKIVHLPEKLKTRITASTVHKFQGDERDVMIYSLVVTSNSPASKINWIDEGARNLVNVAVTRARQSLYVVGNKSYVRAYSSPSKPLGALLNYIERLECCPA